MITRTLENHQPLAHPTNTPHNHCTGCRTELDESKRIVRNSLNHTQYCHNCIKDFEGATGELEDSIFSLEQELALFFDDNPERQGFDHEKLGFLGARAKKAIDDVLKLAKTMEGVK